MTRIKSLLRAPAALVVLACGVTSGAEPESDTPAPPLETSKESKDNPDGAKGRGFGIKQLKKLGGQVAEETHHAEKDVTKTVDKAGKDATHAAHHVEKVAEHASSHAAENVSKTVHKAGKDIANTAHKAGGSASDWTKLHINKPVGAPWVRAVRDPWARYLDRLGASGQHKLDQASAHVQGSLTKGVSHVPMLASGSEFDVRNVPPPGVAARSIYGTDVLAIEAPQGGIVGFGVPIAMDGHRVKITMFVLPVKGQVRVGLERNDGQTDAVSNPYVPAENQHTQTCTLVARVPTDGKGYGGTDSAHTYHAILRLEPGTEVHVLGGSVVRVD